MPTRHLMVAAWAAISSTAFAFEEPEDPFVWLEEVEGERALAWVEARNKESLGELQALPEFSIMEKEATEILNSKDRIAYPSTVGKHVYNFWRDETHVRGIWRRMTREAYVAGSDEWEIVLDVDALAEAEGENWVYKGSSILEPSHDRCLMRLSRGGADAVVVREFDLDSKTFVDGGFQVAEAKSGLSWRDKDTLYIGTDFGAGSLTDSGYPRIAKVWKRGTALKDATTLFEAAQTDMGVWSQASHTPEGQYDFVTCMTSFYSSETHMVEGDSLFKMDIPEDANLSGIFKKQLLVQLKSDWEVGGSTYRQGSLVSIDLDEFKKGARNFVVVVPPMERGSIAGVSTTQNYLLVNLLENVTSHLYQYEFADGKWSREEISVGKLGSLRVTDTSIDSDHYFLTYTSFLTPSTLYTVNGKTREVKELRSLPAFFDASRFQAEQLHAVSADGTKIPYFLLSSKAAKKNGKNPTLLYGYGGFEISMTPNYASTVGKLWLERGGVYAVANIRGGGEFGPKWHQAALKKNRHLAFQDFIAVGEDLVKRGITAPQHLGIRGGSNGGLLVGSVFTQRPDLFGAVVCAVPLLDMRRYNKLLAGASWMAEYGNPDEPDMWDYIKTYSPYHNLSKDKAYPKVLFTTSTRDDRVHPGHARKMVAAMGAMGHPVYYYENTEGGHAGAANNKQRAFTSALTYSYLLDQLQAEVQ